MRLIVLLAILAAVTPSSALRAQEDPASGSGEDPFKDQKGDKRFWNASVGGGNYLVALDKIANISKHRYLLDGTVVVTEVTIDTVGNSLARFYHLSPLAAESSLSTARKVIERGDELLDRAGQRTGMDVADMVQKKYPVTTHAKTIEFRITELATLDALHGSVTKAWRDNFGRKFRAE